MATRVNKKAVILFLIFLLLGISLALAAYIPKGLYLFSFLYRGAFQVVIKIIIILAFCSLIFRWFSKRPLPKKVLKLICGVIFLPLILLPVLRCYFKVPYVFCRICPHKCPWGMLRTFILSSFFTLNLSGRFWCFYLCPLGTFQECQAQISKQNVKLSFRPGLVAYPALILTVGMYFLTLEWPQGATYFSVGHYSWIKITVFTASLIFAAAFFIPRFWCRYFCPVGTIADLISYLRSSLYRVILKFKH